MALFEYFPNYVWNLSLGIEDSVDTPAEDCAVELAPEVFAKARDAFDSVFHLDAGARRR